MLFWTLTHKGITKRGWCHANGLDNAIIAVLYQSGFTLKELEGADSKVRFLYRDSVDLGTYFFECKEFLPTEFFDNNPDVARI